MLGTIREVQTRATVAHYLTFVSVAIDKTNNNNKKKKITSADEHVDKLELLCVIVKREKQYHCEKHNPSLKLKRE